MQALDYPIIDREHPALRTARLPARHLLLLVHLQPAAREVPVHPRRAARPLARGEEAAPRRSRSPRGSRSSRRSRVAQAAISSARGKGGFRRVSWDEVNEIMAAANISHGPASTARTASSASRRSRPCRWSATPPARASCSCMGGVSLSFYDWYCDLPPASPEIWGEQTDVAESADWYHFEVHRRRRLERPDDAHAGRAFPRRGAAPRREGRRLLAGLQPDLEGRGRVGPDPPGTGRRLLDGGRPRHPARSPTSTGRCPYFHDYLQDNTRDAPFLVTLETQADGTLPAGSLLRASEHRRTRRRGERRVEVLRARCSYRRAAHAAGHRRPPLAEAEGRVEPEARGRRRRRRSIRLSRSTGRQTSVPVLFADFSDGTNSAYSARARARATRRDGRRPRLGHDRHGAAASRNTA